MTHRSYQPTQSCGSKLLQQKWDRTYYDEHRRLVKTAKPMVDTKTPPKLPHVVAKWKKQQLEKERVEEIERDNQTLLCKMNKIMRTQGSVVHRHTHKHHSLNDRQRQREMERVATENKVMLQRLEKVRPMYRITDWIDDWQRSEELTQRITAFPTPSHAHSAPSRSKSAPHRMRVASTSTPGDRKKRVEFREKGVESKEEGVESRKKRVESREEGDGGTETAVGSGGEATKDRQPSLLDPAMDTA